MPHFNWHEVHVLLRTTYAGNSLRKWLITGGLVLAGLIAAICVRFFMTRVLPKLTARTESKLDDRLVAATALPLSVLVFFSFVQAALQIPRLPARLHNYTLDANAVAMSLLLAIALWRALNVFFEEVMMPWADNHVPPINRQVVGIARATVKVTTVTFLAVSAMHRAGFDVLSVITGLGIGGVAVALAAQETLANVLGAMQVMTDQPFAVGDVIRVEPDLSGKVERMGLRSTRLITTSGVRIIVPNKRIAAAALQNHSHKEGLIRDLTLQLDWHMGADRIRQAMDILRGILAADPRISDVYSVSVSGFGDWSTNLRVIYYLRNLDEATATASDFLVSVREQFDAAGIALAVPPVAAASPVKPS